MYKLKSIMASAQKVFELDSYELNQEFYLRPKEKRNITIVSLKPEKAMNGVTVKIDAVENEYKNRESLDIPKRIHTETYYEADVQAAFCRGMINGEEAYDDIKFVAAEFLLEDLNKRIDVLGVKGVTLYIFELKKDRTNAVYEQAMNYRENLSDKRGKYLDLLQYYPNMSGYKDIKNVIAIAVMPFSKRHQLKPKFGVTHWFYDVPENYDFSNPLTFSEKT